MEFRRVPSSLTWELTYVADCFLFLWVNSPCCTSLSRATDLLAACRGGLPGAQGKSGTNRLDFKPMESSFTDEDIHEHIASWRPMCSYRTAMSWPYPWDVGLCQFCWVPYAAHCCGNTGRGFVIQYHYTFRIIQRCIGLGKWRSASESTLRLRVFVF